MEWELWYEPTRISTRQTERQNVACSKAVDKGERAANLFVGFFNLNVQM